MSHKPPWQISFPAITPESQQVFLNGRHGMQIPESIVQGIVHCLNSGMAWNNDLGTVELRQKLAAFLHVDVSDYTLEAGFHY